MNISSFLTALRTTGDLKVSRDIQPFSEKEWKDALVHLEKMYAEDVHRMPLSAPAFHRKAAIWGAGTIYRIVQLILMRDLEEEAIRKHLNDYSLPVSAEVIYSADLCLRYLPALWSLAKGLAPGDPLINRLQELAEAWPFSSVGLEIKGEKSMELIQFHPSLWTAYIDRILEAKDLKRANHPDIIEKIHEALGDYGKSIWPEFFIMQNT
jgi:hypothetical protein